VGVVVVVLFVETGSGQPWTLEYCRCDDDEKEEPMLFFFCFLDAWKQQINFFFS